MSIWVNTGAFVNGKRPASKAALKRAIAEAPETVTFDPTSVFTAAHSEYRPTVESISYDKLSVVGPDPYRKRTWYATVQVVNGKVKIT